MTKALTRMMLFSCCLFLGTVGNVSANQADAGSKTLDVQLKRPMIQLISNVVYEQVPMFGYDNVAMKMDILKPQKQGEMPAIVYITGGGFISANKDSYIQQRMAFAEAGYVVASIQYRVAPTAVFPQPLADVKAAIRYLKANAAKYNINADKIGVIGESAGGYLAAMAGTTCGTTQFDKGENLDQNSNVQAVIDIYGLSDLTKVGADFSQAVQNAHKSAGATEALWVNGSPVFGGKDGGILADREKAEAANPITYISDKTPPFLLMHGDHDTLVSPSQTEILHQALLAHGIEATRYIVKGAQHGGVYWVQPEVIRVMIDFFDQHLK
jgi:acetyl esterase/lipase